MAVGVEEAHVQDADAVHVCHREPRGPDFACVAVVNDELLQSVSPPVATLLKNTPHVAGAKKGLAGCQAELQDCARDLWCSRMGLSLHAHLQGPQFALLLLLLRAIHSARAAAAEVHATPTGPQRRGRGVDSLMENGVRHPHQHRRRHLQPERARSETSNSCTS